MFQIWHRKGVSTSSGSRGVRIAIPYWSGWTAFSFIVLWTILSIEMVHSDWQGARNGVLGPQSLARLHLGETFVALGFLVAIWMAAGRQVITLDSSYLSVRTEVLGLRWSRRYLLTEISGLGASCFLPREAAEKWNPDHLKAGIYFDYRGKMRSFGNDLSWQDALQIEKLIRSFLKHHETAA